MIIAIASSKGGVGKTNTALNLSDALKPDIIIDRDTHKQLSIINARRTEQDRLPVYAPQTKQELGQLLQQTEQGKLILVDCGGFDSDLNRLVIKVADLIITPSNDDEQELVGLRNFNQTLKEISDQKAEHIHTHIVWSRMHPRRTQLNEALDFIGHGQHLKHFESKIAHRSDFNKAMKNGLGVTKDKRTKYGKAAKEIHALAAEIKTLLNLK